MIDLGVFYIDKIASYKRTKEIINKYKFYFKKSLGQNFLIDNHVISKIINIADLKEDDIIIEIGPGIGGLTQELAKCVRKVIAIEIDSSLIFILKDTLKDYNNVEILNMDILDVDLKSIINSLNNYHKIKVIANLPYYITTPILMKFLESEYKVDTLTIMVQKEVGYRINAKPRTKSYGSLSLAVQYYAKPYIVANVPKNCFIPRPNVDSIVVHLSINKIKLDVLDEHLMFNIIRAAFRQRRKTLLNCIFNMDEFNYEKDEISFILLKCGFNINVRGEELSIIDFVKLSNFIKINKSL